MASVKIVDNSRMVLQAMKSPIGNALEKIGLTAERYAKESAPVDTGRLRNSITHEVDEKDVYIGTNVEYAPHVEFGTVKQKAQPFLRPAATDHSETYKQIILDEFAKIPD